MSGAGSLLLEQRSSLGTPARCEFCFLFLISYILCAMPKLTLMTAPNTQQKKRKEAPGSETASPKTRSQRDRTRRRERKREERKGKERKESGEQTNESEKETRRQGNKERRKGGKKTGLSTNNHPLLYPAHCRALQKI